MQKTNEINNRPIPKRKIIKSILKLWFWSILHLGHYYMPKVPEIKSDELYQKLSSKQSTKPIMLIDLREKIEVQKEGYIEGSTFFPYFNLLSNLDKIPRDPSLEIVTMCPGGGASLIMAEILLSEGFKDVKSLKAGFRGYRKKKFPFIYPSSQLELDKLFTTKEYDLTKFLEERKSKDIENITINHSLDANNLSCPQPVLEARKVIKTLQVGEILEILTTDPGSLRDIPAWVINTKQELISYEKIDNNHFRFLVKRKN